jgi:signal transduction histidine kinase
LSEAEGSQARVRVMDNGPGVSKTVRPRLFEPFVTSKPNGVGVGLALSRRIARAHGGDIVLEDSQPGAAFDLILPAEAS